MSVVNLSQMIEKEKQRVAPLEYWRSQSNRNAETNREESVFDNCLSGTDSGIPVIEHLADVATGDTVLHKDSDIWTKNIDKDSGNSASDNTCSFFDDTDDTDYFDSEDEYWDNLRNKEIKVELCQHCLCYHLPKSIQDAVLCPYEEVYDTYPAYTPAVQKFARENSFEIHDVYGDEDCLFRAVADQFMINGFAGHTEATLRETAIIRMRKDPVKYGIHGSTFHSGESWTAYLQKIDKTREWGNRMFMQILADLFMLHISIFSFDHNNVIHSRIIPAPAEMTPKTFHIFLGHVGKQHIFSFRPLQWMTELPYKAQICRLLVTCTNKTLIERRELVDKTFALMSPRHFPKSNLTEYVVFALQCITSQEEARHEQIFKSYRGSDLEEEDSQDIRRKLLEDQANIDPMSGIPLTILRFIMKIIFPYEMFDGVCVKHTLLRIGEKHFHYFGSFADQSCITLRDISRTQEMSKLDSERIRDLNYYRIVVLKKNFEAIFANDFEEDTEIKYVIVDTSISHPGFCRLRLSSSSLIDVRESVAKIGAVMYQKPFIITDKLRSDLDVKYIRKVQCIGVPCYTFPFGQRWKKRRYDFPSEKVIASMIQEGCTLIPRSHPKSTCPDIEWQFNFSIAEHLLFQSLTVSQRHGFLVIKVLLCNMLQHLPFKTRHLKFVFFMTCEEMPVDAWEKNFSGCVLYVLSSLLSCLKARYLPNYFIPENNLIDCYREDDISTLSSIVEYIRLFPTYVVQIVAHKYGYTYGANLIKCVLSQKNHFDSKIHLQAAFVELSGPLTISTAKIMAKMGFYGISLDILQDTFEQSLLIPQRDLRQTSFSFYDFFLSALMEMKQKVSRVNLARTFDERMGTNVSDMILENKEVTLQTCLPWTIDRQLGWIKAPCTANNANLTSIANFLYEFSIREYWRRNTMLAELAINTAIRCVQEALKPTLCSQSDSNAQQRMLKEKLISFYMHVSSISVLNNLIYPLVDHMTDIENLCVEFPQMAGSVACMLSYIHQPEKSEEYVEKVTDYMRTRMWKT